MITGFAVRNFKNLAHVPEAEGKLIPFGPLNVLIGPNGAGKSSLLQAIDFLRAFFHSSVEVYLRDRGWTYRDIPNLRQSTQKIRWEMEAHLDADGEGLGAGKYSYCVELKPRRHLAIGQEVLTYCRAGDQKAVELIWRDGRQCRLLNREHEEVESYNLVGVPASVMASWDTRAERNRYPEAFHFREWVERFRSYLIWDPKILRSPDRGSYDELGPSGEHLAVVLGRLKERNPDAFKKLIRRVRRLFPTVSDITLSRGKYGWCTLRLHEGDGDSVSFNSQQMSDGVLRLLAVTSLLYLDSIPTVLTFEEPENGVHPQILREVVQILRELTQRKPPNRCQVFFTTHSPYVLDEFLDHPEEVYCVERSAPRAGAQVLRLSENRHLKIARDAFDKSLGEAWVSGLIGARAGESRP